MSVLKYKEYEGSAEIDMESMIIRGKILFINDLVTYKASSPDALLSEFKDAVDDYIETCKQLNRQPQKPLKGQFNVRVQPELHKAAHLRAAVDKTSLNDIVSKALDAYLSPTAEINHSVTLKLNIENIESKKLIATASTSNWSKSNAITTH